MHKMLLPFNPLVRELDSYRHPDQAAFLARVPLLGKRVPERDFWAHESISPRRMLRHGIHQAATTFESGRRRGMDAGRYAKRARPHLRHRSESVGDEHLHSHPVVHRTRVLPVALAVVAGAAAMYYLDAASGRRRRAMVRDRLAHMKRVFRRDVPRMAGKRGRFIGGVARGVRHTAGELLPHGHMAVDNETLVARVRSEVLRDFRYKAGEIHFDAYEGCVTLRGQLQEEHDIRDIVDRTRRVEGVAEVRSYLHTPGTPPPNKAQSYADGVPQHMVR